MKFLTGALTIFLRKKRPVADNPPQIKSFDVYYTHNPVFGIDMSVGDSVQSSVVGFYGQNECVYFWF